MSQLILPPSAQPAQPLVQPGAQLQAFADGPNVVIRQISTIVLAPENAAQFVQALAGAVQAAAQFREAVLNPAPIVANGHV